MLSLDVDDRYRITVSEMSRKSQLAISAWFNEWMLGAGEMDKLHTVITISTQVILHSRIALYRDGVRLPDGTYELPDGTVFTLPMTEACLNDLPASLCAWLIDAAGRENAFTLGSFLAGTRAAVTRQTKTYERRSGSGLLNRPTPH